MKLADFLKLSQSCIMKNRLFISLFEEYENGENGLKPVLIAQIKKTDPVFLIRYALINRMFDDFCKEAGLVGHWQMIWMLCGINRCLDPILPKELTKDGYLLSHLMSCFDLIKGEFLYWQYKIESTGENPDDAQDYLMLSAELSCFKSMEIFCFKKLQLIQKSFSRSEADFLLDIARKCAENHWTPGYLLLANVSIQLASIMKKKDVGFFTQASMIQDLYVTALGALHFAETLAVFSKSQIHNAYDGRSIAEKYQGTALTNLASVRERLLTNHAFLKD